MSNYDNWKTNPPEPDIIEDNNNDTKTHFFIDNKEKIAEEYQKKYCNFLTVKEILKYKYGELVKFYERRY